MWMTVRADTGIIKRGGGGGGGGGGGKKGGFFEYSILV